MKGKNLPKNNKSEKKYNCLSLCVVFLVIILKK